MANSGAGGCWKGGLHAHPRDALTPTPVRRVGVGGTPESTCPQGGVHTDLDKGSFFPMTAKSASPKEQSKGHMSALHVSTQTGAPTVFCRICLEAASMIPQEATSLDVSCPFPFPPCAFRPKVMMSEDSDKLISPCACTGTQAYVHYACLRTWQKSVLASSRYGEPGTTIAASVCSVCTHRFSVQPPPLAIHIRVQRYAELYARELIWFFLFLGIFYFLLACNLGSIPFFASMFTALRSAAGLENSSTLPREPLGPGTVLVASPTKMSPSSIFFRSVVVVYENEAKSGGAVSGVIINKPIKKSDVAKTRAWEVPLFLDEEGKGLPRLLGWGGPLARSALTLMDMCPCCLPDPTGGPQCCHCSCRPAPGSPTAVLEQGKAAPGQKWARYIFPGLFLGTDTRSLSTLQSAAAPSQFNADRCRRARVWEDAAAALAEADGDGESAAPPGPGNSSRVVLMGHALWQPGQLEAEIRAGWWLVLADIQTQDTLSMPLKLLWKSLVASHIGQAHAHAPQD